MGGIRVFVRLYSSFREPVGSDSLELELPGDATVASLLEVLQSEYPAMPGFENAVTAVNGKHQDAGWTLKEGDVLAIMPPVAGG